LYFFLLVGLVLLVLVLIFLYINIYIFAIKKNHKPTTKKLLQWLKGIGKHLNNQKTINN
jgi:hypothetical protein